MSGIPFGKYQLIKRLARGGMAEVFLARQSGPEGFQRTVAVKRILPHLVDSQDFVRMFLDEARLAAQLTHPNVVHIYDFGKVDEHYFIAMEYVDGVHAGVLINHAETERLPDVLVARLGADACAGLHYAHEIRDGDGRALHIVHRDVSPPNLLVSYDGSIKLVDFGIAKAVGSIEQTRPGVVKGKFAYMSPEQTVGQKLDGRSDVFSLAVLLWELLAGRVMVPRQDPMDGMRMIRDGRVPTIEQARPDIAPALGAALGRALQTRREDRSTVAELGRALEEFIKESRDGLGSSLELAQWVRARFPRESLTGNCVALSEEPAGTRPSTRAATALPPGDIVVPLSDPSAPPPVGAHPAQGAFPPLDPVRLRAPVQARTQAGLASRPSVSDLGFDDEELGSGQDEPSFGIESSSVIVADDWLRDDRNARSFDTLAEDHRADTVEAVPQDFAVQSFDTEMDISKMLASEIFGEDEERDRLEVRRRPRRATSQIVRRSGRVALVIAAGAALGVSSTLVLKEFGPGSVDEPRGRDAPVSSARAAPALSARADHAPAAARSSNSGPAGEPAPAAAPLAPEHAFIEVVTAPPGARVSLGDHAPVKSPAQFEEVEPGSYHLRVVLRGHQTIERTIEVSAGEHRSIELDLVADKESARGDERRKADEPEPADEPTSGVLKVRTRPYSDVYIDGRRLGTTPLITELPPGRYRLQFKHPGKPSQHRTIVVRSGDETKLDFELN